jgi:hypothetical protein
MTFVAAWPQLSVTTSYANPGGQGNRIAIIVISTTATVTNGGLNDLIDGTLGNVFAWAGAETTRQFVFDFGVGASKVIDEFTWSQHTVAAQGTWCFEGSNDGSSYTTFPETFVLGSSATQQVVPITNSTGYRYYRLRQTTGTTSGTAYIREITFKIG